MYTFSKQYLVSIHGLVFNIFNSIQTKGTAKLTHIFADVYMCMTMHVGAVGEIWESLKCRLITEKYCVQRFSNSYLHSNYVEQVIQAVKY